MKDSKSPYGLITGVCCMLVASSIGICMNSAGVFYAPVSEALGIGRGVFAFHATLSSIAIGLFSVVAVKLIQRYPAKLMISLGIIIAGTTTFLMSEATQIWTFYLLGILRGIGCSFYANAVVAVIIGNWFYKRNGLITGLVLSTSGISGAIFNPLLSGLIDAYSWQFAYKAMGIIIIVLALPGALTILRFRPEERGLVAYGMLEQSRIEVKVSIQENRFKRFNPKFIFMAFLALFCTSISGIAQHFPGYAKSIELDVTIGAIMVSAAMIGNIVFKLILGILSDLTNPFKACSIVLGINLFSLAILSFIGNSTYQPVVYIAAFLYGSIYAVGAVGLTLVTREIFGVNHFAEAYGYISLFINVGSALALTIIGFVYDWTNSYQLAFAGGIFSNLISLCLLYLLSNKKCIIGRRGGKLN